MKSNEPIPSPRRIAPPAVWTALSALILLAVAAGCDGAAGPNLPVGPVVNPIEVQADFDPLLDAIDRTLRDHRFAIYRKDARLGQIVTEPLVGQQAWEIWRTDSAGLYNQLESSTSTILRTVDARVYPVRDDKGAALPARFFLDMRVYTERLSVPEREITAANQMEGIYGAKGRLVDALSLERDKAADTHPVFLSRDSDLEAWLIRDVLRRIPRNVPIPSESAEKAPPA